MNEKKAIFEPPYDSPIEEIFAWNFTKYVDKEVELLTQYEVNSTHGNFFIDFVLKLGDILIGVECDGKDYHDLYRDIWRDIVILNHSNVTEIFRFRGCDINFHINECLLSISWCYSSIFDKRGTDILNKISAHEVVQEKKYMFNTGFEHRYKDSYGQFNTLKIHRSNAGHFWYDKITKVSNQNPTLSVDQLYKKYK